MAAINRIELGELLLKIRKRESIYLADMADMLGLSDEKLSEFEYGFNHMSDDTFKKISEIYLSTESEREEFRLAFEKHKKMKLVPHIYIFNSGLPAVGYSGVK